MTDTCVPYGWGIGPYGQTPWGGSTIAYPGGPIPSFGGFDIYCVGPCGQMSVLDTYLEVQEYAQPGQIAIVPVFLDFELRSGGLQPTSTARIFVDKSVPGSWTFDATFKFQALPSDFTNLTERHCFFGVTDDGGFCAGLFFSSVGIGYTGSVRYDLSGNLLLNSTFQVLPSSLGLITEGVYYTVRVVLDAVTGTTFVYVTETSQLPLIGHQLRYILPAIPSSSCVVPPTDGTVISVRGTVADQVILDVGTLCLGTGVILPNLPPVADAGLDQAARFCTIVRLDGARSYDPEGVPVSYKWRLIDGPEPSSNVFAGHDGLTYTPSPFTNRFYSVTLEDFHNTVSNIVNNDVLLLDNVPYDVISVGVDGNGFYVQTYGFSLPANLTQKNFKLLRQNTISGPTTVNPTFYPDVVGLYKFDLVVFDGNFNSAPSISVVNVVDSPVARGCIPDLSFIWSYLSDFWRLVDNKEIIQTFWSAVAQVTASELLAVWQHEYGKSLRDIQRTFQRKWLHYDLYLQDPVAEQSTTRVLYAGIQSDTFTGPVLVTGKTLQVTSPISGDFEIRLSGVTFTDVELQAELLRQFQKKDKRFSVELQSSGANRRLVVRAEFPFEFQLGSSLGIFTYPVKNALPSGNSGAGVGVDTYVVERRLDGVGVLEGDYLVLAGRAYRIKSLINDSSDDWGYQRLVLSEPLGSAAPSDWVICGPTTSKFVDFYTALVSQGDTALFEVIDTESDEPTYVQLQVLSAASFREDSYLFVDVSLLYEYFSQPERYSVFFFSVYRRTYLPVSSFVVDVPTLQELIKNSDEQAVLRQNIDYFVEDYRGQHCLRFVTGDEPALDVWQHELPARRMWAEVTYLDNRPTIEANFGLPAEFTLDNLAELPETTDYLSVVRGLWYAYFNGPTVYNLRVGTQILLGLPFAEENGIITEIRTDFSSQQGRILIQDEANTEVVRSYEYPRLLSLEVNPDTGVTYVVGDSVRVFAPLVQGVAVTDYVNDPMWFEGYLQQGVFSEIEKFFRFLVRIDSNAFSLSTLILARDFVLKIKPTYTYPLFVVRNQVGDADSTVTDIDITDELAISGTLKLYDRASAVKGLGGIIDDPDPSGGGWQSQLDSGHPVYVSPTYPNPSPIIPWGGDKTYLSPEDFIYASACIILGAPTLPTLDSIYVLDSFLFTDTLGVFGNAGVTAFLPAPGPNLSFAATAVGAFSLTAASIDYQTSYANPALAVRLVISINAIDVHTHNFTIGAGVVHEETVSFASIPVVLNDVVAVRIEAQGASALPVTWATVAVELGATYTWVLDTPVPAGTYCTYKLM